MQGLRLRRRGRGISAEESRAMLEFYKHTYLCCGWRGMRSSYNGIYYPPEMQQGDEFEWDSHNEDKLAARHGVDRYEAEEAAADPGAIVKRAGRDRYGNRRYVYVGKTEDGRILFMVVDRKGERRWRVGSARDAKFEEKRAYRKRNR